MMFESLLNLHPILQAGIATLFTWSITAIGAALVFFFKKINIKLAIEIKM